MVICQQDCAESATLANVISLFVHPRSRPTNSPTPFAAILHVTHSVWRKIGQSSPNHHPHQHQLVEPPVRSLCQHWKFQRKYFRRQWEDATKTATICTIVSSSPSSPSIYQSPPSVCSFARRHWGWKGFASIPTMCWFKQRWNKLNESNSK